MITAHFISEKRAAAARANGAKSRGPTTSRGKANSSRNSLRHGLRSQTLLRDLPSDLDPNALEDRTALLAEFMSELRPQSEIERELVEAVAFSHWNRTRVWKLEWTILDRETRSAGSLAAAFRNLNDHTCALELLNRLESRFSRQYHQASIRLLKLQGAKAVVDDQPQQVIENTEIPAPQGAVVDEPLQQVAEIIVPPRRGGVFRAQRSALSARQRIVSRRADKYRVECALSVLIRFSPSPVLGLPGGTQ